MIRTYKHCKFIRDWNVKNAKAALAASPSGSTFDAIPSSSMMVGRGTTTAQCRLSMNEITTGREERRIFEGLSMHKQP